MKIYIDPSEEFVVKIPDDWYFTTLYHDGNRIKQPYSFEPYKNPNSAFQISFKSAEIYEKLKIEEQALGEPVLNFIITEFNGIKSWITKVNQKVLLITFTYDTEIDEQVKHTELEKAHNAVKSIMVFDKDSKNKNIPGIRWDKFMLSYVASIDLSNRAYNSGSNIELVIILANQIDAVLRQSLILKGQLDNKTDTIDVSLIHQNETDKPIFEKTIYKKALEANLINQKTHHKLIELYEIRNKVVHRYIISDLLSNDIIELVWSYSKIYDFLREKVVDLEKRQFEEQIGLFKGETPPETKPNKKMIDSLISKIRDKHSNKKFNEGITLGKYKSECNQGNPDKK